MDQTYNVHMTDEAVADLKQAVDWIKEEYVEAARAFFVDIKLRISSDLAHTPHMGVRLQMVEGHNIFALTNTEFFTLLMMNSIVFLLFGVSTPLGISVLF